MIYTVIGVISLLKSYSDQTGKFPVKFSSSNQYIFIMYYFDIYSIPNVPIKSRRDEDIAKA